MGFFEARVLTELDPVRDGVSRESSFREARVPSVAHVIDWFSSVVGMAKGGKSGHGRKKSCDEQGSVTRGLHELRRPCVRKYFSDFPVD